MNQPLKSGRRALSRPFPYLRPAVPCPDDAALTTLHRACYPAAVPQPCPCSTWPAAARQRQRQRPIALDPCRPSLASCVHHAGCVAGLAGPNYARPARASVKRRGRQSAPVPRMRRSPAPPRPTARLLSQGPTRAHAARRPGRSGRGAAGRAGNAHAAWATHAALASTQTQLAILLNPQHRTGGAAWAGPQPRCCNTPGRGKRRRFFLNRGNVTGLPDLLPHNPSSDSQAIFLGDCADLNPALPVPKPAAAIMLLPSPFRSPTQSRNSILPSQRSPLSGSSATPCVCGGRLPQRVPLASIPHLSDVAVRQARHIFDRAELRAD